VTNAWKRDPRLPGQTIDLEADEDAFREDARALGVDADALYPAVADALRWTWRRHMKDRPNEGAWQRAVRQELPRRQTAADAAVQRSDLWPGDWRTKAGRAIKAALRAGGLARAQAVALGFQRATEARGLVNGGKPVPVKTALTDAAVKPWTARPADEAWKRRLPDRTKPLRVAKVPGRPGRPRKRPVTPDELAALGHVLGQAGPQVRAMFADLSTDEDRLSFLLDLRAVIAAPDDVRAQRRWAAWVSRSAGQT
jgi:hypothetical protein